MGGTIDPRTIMRCTCANAHVHALLALVHTHLIAFDPRQPTCVYVFISAPVVRRCADSGGYSSHVRNCPELEHSGDGLDSQVEQC